MDPANRPKILNNKIFLYLTEFFAGMSVMAVELGASRLLAPYFSSSQIVWTIIIGTIMIAMALEGAARTGTLTLPGSMPGFCWRRCGSGPSLWWENILSWGYRLCWSSL